MPNDEANAEDPDETQRLYGELLAGFRQLIDSGVSVSELRNALMGSFMITNAPNQAREYDELRLEIDAYLRSLEQGEAGISVPDGFVASPQLGPDFSSKPENEDA